MSSPFALRLRRDQHDLVERIIADHPHLNDRNSVIRTLIDRGADDLQAEIELLQGREKKT